MVRDWDSGGMVSYAIHGVKQCAIQLHPGLVTDTVGIMSGYDFYHYDIYSIFAHVKYYRCSGKKNPVNYQVGNWTLCHEELGVQPLYAGTSPYIV